MTSKVPLFMKPGLVFILLCLLELFAVAQASLNLPLPDGGRVQFVPVFLKIGPKLRSSRNFVMGDRKQPPRWEERPTEVAIGGSFVIPDAAGRKDWGYYLGVTEVTEAQWNAVMGAPGGSDLPKTDVSFFDVQDFIRRWNEWLHKNALADLPANEGSYGYVRLPTEVEWEFAARGGTVVPQELFDAVHPYSDLSRHEWFFGVDDSPHVHPVGTREKNPLGLSDMLGNVSELTMGEFHLEYYLGRVGGCVVRGGDLYLAPI